MELFQTHPLPPASIEKVIRRFPPIFWIVLISFLIRLVFILAVPPASIDYQADDAGYYHLTALQFKEYFRQIGPLAKEILAGNLGKGQGLLEKYGLEIPWGAFKRGPVYPFFVAGLYSLFGPNPFWVFVIQALLMSLACGLIYGIAKELGEPKAGLGAAVLMGIYPPFIFIVDKLYQETLAVFLFALFYFLAFRTRRKNSIGLWVAAGAALFLLSLSRSPLAFFSLFLFVVMIIFSRAWVLVLTFLVPYAIWAGMVSWQFGHPAVVVEPVGRELFSALVPDYDGWTPDTYLDRRPDARAAEVLQREGILESSPSGTLEWPSQPQMVSAALRRLWKHPWTSFRMAAEKFIRLWWQPYDWPWREYLFPPEPVRWFHRFLVLTAVTGAIFWFLKRPRAVLFLAFPAMYGSLFHSFFHIESRYALTFMVFFPLFSASLLQRIRSSRKALVLVLILSLFTFFDAFQEPAGAEWSLPLRNLNRALRQEIFLPSASLQDSTNQNLRLDLELPPEAKAWGIWLNGEWLGSLETLKVVVPSFLMKPPYRVYLHDMQKEVFEVRQWFTVPLAKSLLKENDFNVIEIRAANENPGNNARRMDWKIFGDPPFSVNPPVFSGPLFERSPTETSVFSLWYLSDFRLKGKTPLHHGGVRSEFYDGENWQAARGEYRIRIEVQRPDGEFLVY